MTVQDIELDHVFVMCAAGAPEAEALVRLGFTEGSSNVHPGQGTRCRRFFLRDQYLELLWVHDPVEAQSEQTRNTRLWTRWSERDAGACPFGIVLRSADPTRVVELPYPAWVYAPGYSPPGVAIHIASDTMVTEPEFFFLGFQRARPPQESVDHRLAVDAITRLTFATPSGAPRSAAARWAHASGLLRFERADDYALHIELDGAGRGAEDDLRPELPLVFRW